MCCSALGAKDPAHRELTILTKTKEQLDTYKIKNCHKKGVD